MVGGGVWGGGGHVGVQSVVPTAVALTSCLRCFTLKILVSSLPLPNDDRRLGPHQD